MKIIGISVKTTKMDSLPQILNNFGNIFSLKTLFHIFQIRKMKIFFLSIQIMKVILEGNTRQFSVLK